MTGTVVAQAIPILISPILTRVFSPADFGQFAFYLAIVTVLATVVSGKYEQAIPLPKSERTAICLTWLSLLLTLSTTAILVIFVLIWYGYDNSVFVYYELSIESLAWIVLGTLILGAYQSINYWLIRTQDYKKISKNKVVQAFFNASISILVGAYITKSSGLIIGDIISRAYAFLDFFKRFYSPNHQPALISKTLLLNARILMRVAKNYKDYPVFLIPGSLMNILAKQMPFIVFGFIYSPILTGLMMMAQRIILGPLGIISTSFSQALLKTMADQIRVKGECWQVYKKSLLILLLIPIPIVILGYFLLEKTIILVFGGAWIQLTEVVFILTPYFYIYLVSGTLNIVIIAAGKQKVNLLIQVVFFLIVSIAIAFCAFYNIPEIDALKVLSAANVLFFCFSLIISSLIAKGKI